MYCVSIYFSSFLKDAIQAAHWNHEQVTLHPFAIYYKDENLETKMQSFLIIADSLEHTYEAVHQFKEELFKYLKEKFALINKIFFFSDGAASQYKNKKNFFELCQHEKEYGFNTERHFFATSHGKGPCDGIGGIFKRNATRASLQRKFEGHIRNAKELYDWAIGNENSVMVYRYCSAVDFKKFDKKLKTKYGKINLQTVVGTQQYHCFIPINDKEIKAARFSASNEFHSLKLTKDKGKGAGQREEEDEDED